MQKRLVFLCFFLITSGLLGISCSSDSEPFDSANEEINEETSTEDETDQGSTDDTNDGSSEENTDDDSPNNDTDTSGEDDTSDDGSMNGDQGDSDGDNMDDDSAADNGTQTTLLTGNWRLVSAMVENGEASTTFNNAVVTFPFSSSSKEENVDITFQENPNIIQGMGQYTNVLEFTIINQSFTEETTFNSPLTNGNWEIMDNQLIISGSDQTDGAFTVVQLTSNTATLQTEFEETVPTEDFELDVTGVLVIELARN